LAELRVVTPDNEQQVDYQVLEKVDKSKIKDIPTCFFENSCHRHLLDTTIVPNVIFESRQIFFNFEEAAIAVDTPARWLVPKIRHG
jgi:hypothetical protein